MGPRRASALLILSIFMGCESVSQGPDGFANLPFPPVETITAIAFDRNGEVLWFSSRVGPKCMLRRLTLKDRTVSDAGVLDDCPEQIFTTPGGFLLSRDGASWSLDHAGRKSAPEGSILSGLRSPRLVRDGVLGIAPSGSGEAVVKVSSEGSVRLSPEFSKVDSFDVSPDEKEIVLSADQGKGFDVALAPTNRSGDIRWIFPDPLPERGVSWAPRGNKVTYRLESTGGTVLRTVHVPTAFQLSIDLPLMSVSALAWEPKAEKFAMVTSALDRSPAIELVRYGGEDREVLFGGTTRLTADVDRVGEMYLLAPAAVRYGQTVPLVIWATGEEPFTWSGARSALHSTVTVASAVGDPAGVAGALREAVANLPWLDKSRIFVIYRKPTPPDVVLPDGVSVTVIAPTAVKRNAYSVREGNPARILVPVQQPEQIDAFAAEWIRRQLQSNR